MAKEIYLYGNINSDSAKQFVMDMDAQADSDIDVRVSTSGGDPQAMYGMYAKFKEHKGKKLVKVDGKANSSGLFFLCAADDSECLNVSEFAIHRAAFPEWMEKYATDEAKASLKVVNDGLRAIIESKLDVAEFTKISGKTMDDIFSLDSRITVSLNATQAKKVNLVKRIVSLTDVEKVALDEKVFSISGEKIFNIAAQVDPPKTIKAMTKEEFKAANPTAYAEIVAEGQKIGEDKEYDRIQACLVFNEVDPKGVKTAIEARKPLTLAQTSEFMLAANSPTYLEKLKASSAAAVQAGGGAGGADDKTAEQKEFSDFNADVKKYLGKK